MEPDQVDAALDAVQQAAQFADMPRRVVQAAHHDIFERHAPLVREVVPAQDGRDFGDRPCPFDRHDCGPLLVKRVVQTYGQMHFRRVEKPLQFGRYARRGEGDARRRPAEAPLGRKHFDGPQYGVGVVERPGYGLKFADRRSHHHAAKGGENTKDTFSEIHPIKI